MSEATGSVPPEAAAFWPRLGRALVLMAVAVNLHVWVVPSPYPRRSSLPAFAAWVISTPVMPAAPGVQWLGSSRYGPSFTRPVVVQSRLARVEAPSTSGDSPWREPRERNAVPVGTSGYVVAAAAMKPSSLFHRVLDLRLPVTSSAGVRTLPLAAPVEAAAPEPAATVARTPPADVASTAADARRTTAASAADDIRRQKEIVLSVLRAYTRAYERLDVGATKAVYPSVDDRGLRRAFEGLRATEMRFAFCGVSISSSGADANARCQGEATFRPKVGSRVRYTDRVWTFSLSRDGSGWQILNARMQ